MRFTGGCAPVSAIVGRRETTMLPDFTVTCYGNDDRLPEEAEDLFRKELADSRTPLPGDRPDRGQWRFACVCAVAAEGHVLGEKVSGQALSDGNGSAAPRAREGHPLRDGQAAPARRVTRHGRLAMQWTLPSMVAR